MYGGIFTNRPFEFNLKCIFISLFLGLAYWFSPKQNPIVLMLVLILSYLAISWYDYMYDCEPQMKSGQYNPRSIFKYQGRDPNNMARVPPPEYTYLRLVYVFHLFIVAPLVIYCGFVGYERTPKENTFDVYMFSTLAGVGILAAKYHSFRLVYPRQITPTEGSHDIIEPEQKETEQKETEQKDVYTGAPTPEIITLGGASYINARGIRG